MCQEGIVCAGFMLRYFERVHLFTVLTAVVHRNVRFIV